MGDQTLMTFDDVWMPLPEGETVSVRVPPDPATVTLVAPFDYALYHDCHVSGLKVIDMRPGMVERAQDTSSIGHRSHASKNPQPVLCNGRFILFLTTLVDASRGTGPTS